ncbi:hypothetical protein HDU93_000540 [Gonapodya sp. JEL0774]|nr:hypothetical protein HDU93_000540 [Gonapodya sp. JEL0774]
MTSDASETGPGANFCAAPAPPSVSTTTSKGDQLIHTSACWSASLLIWHLHTLYTPAVIQTWFSNLSILLTEFIRIQVLEAISSFLGLKAFVRKTLLQGKTILLPTDNTASAYTMAKRGQSLSPALSMVVS